MSESTIHYSENIQNDDVPELMTAEKRPKLAGDKEALKFSYISAGLFLLGVTLGVFDLFIVSFIVYVPGAYFGWKSRSVEDNLVGLLGFVFNLISATFAGFAMALATLMITLVSIIT